MNHADAHPGRERFDRAEITDVLAHYETGKISSVRELIAGSSSAPKAVIECERGKLLLKRRAPGLDHASIVGFAHEIVLGCLARGVCVTPLIGTNDGNNSMCQLVDRTYELFVFIEGTGYARRADQAQSTGAVLAELHRAADTIEPTFDASTEADVVDAERPVRLRMQGADLNDASRILSFALESHTLNAPNKDTNSTIVHGDWHPGNMIYNEDELVCVCDFDNTRIGSRARELAQSLVYFSMRAPGENTDALDPALFSAVWNGYSLGGGAPQDPRLIAALLPAVVLDEALGATEMGDADPKLLTLALRKARWINDHASELETLLRGSSTR